MLVMPAGRSSHLEAGYAVGAGKKLYILLNKVEFQPDLMYKMANGLVTDIDQLLEVLK